MADASPLSRPETAAWQGAEQDPQNWVRALRSAPGDRDVARARLYELLLQVARSEAKRRWSAAAAPEEPGDLAGQAATAAVLAIASNLDGYSGDTRFMTWASKYVIYRLSDAAGRRFWHASAPPSEELDWKRLATPPRAPGPPSPQWRGIPAAPGPAAGDTLPAPPHSGSHVGTRCDPPPPARLSTG